MSKQRKRNLDKYTRVITGNSLGHIDENGQLACKHPGARKNWLCEVCREELATNKLFEDHNRKTHHVKTFVYVCGCGYSSENAKSTGAHMRYCDGKPPGDQSYEHQCKLCKFSSKSENGLKVHISIAHKEAYNETLKDKEKGYKWTEAELEYLARIIRDLKKERVRGVNKAAGEKIGRTEAAVQKIRTKGEYKLAEQRVKEADQRIEDKRDRRNVEEQTESVVEVPDIDDEANRVYQEIPLEQRETPRQEIRRRRLPIVPPTPHIVDTTLTELLLTQQNLSITDTPSGRRMLPTIPLEKTNQAPMVQRSNSQRRNLQAYTPIQPRREPTINPPVNYVVNPPVTYVVNPQVNNVVNRPINNVAGRPSTRKAVPVIDRTENTPGVVRRDNQRGNNRRVLLAEEGKPDYKRTAYLDARSYANTLGDTLLDLTVKRYLEGELEWKEVTKVIAGEQEKAKAKKPRIRKGPWMKNRRENRNTRKAKRYQFTQKAYDQNRKATITKIIDGTFSLDNENQTFPDITEVEKTYEERLEKGNTKDETVIQIPERADSDSYGKFTEDEVRSCLNEIKRKTAAGIDGVTCPDLKKVPTGHITAIMNHWWGWRIPKESEECRTTLLPKKEKDLDQVGNWRPITVGNLFMRLYGKLWDKRLRDNIELDEREKGFVPVDGCFENVKILQQVIKQQRKKRKEYNLVFIDLAKAFDTVSHKSIEKGLQRKGVPEEVIETIMGMYTHATTVITVGGKSTKQIKINAGVKQGCPLSPLLFNLIIDELLEKLRRLNIGIKVGDDLLYCMAFADDLVLLTEERIHMQILIEETKQFFDDKGLTANAGKCASLRVVPVAKKTKYEGHNSKA